MSIIHCTKTNSVATVHMYSTLAETMNMSGFGVPEVKTKIKNLRSTYSQELKKYLIRKNPDLGLTLCTHHKSNGST